MVNRLDPGNDLSLCVGDNDRCWGVLTFFRDFLFTYFDIRLMGVEAGYGGTGFHDLKNFPTSSL